MLFYQVPVLAGLAYFGLRTFLYGTNDSFSLLDAAGTGLRLPLLVFLLSGALCATFAEFFSKKGLGGIIDDNLTVPLASALGLILGGYFLASYPIELLLDPFWD